MQQGQEYTLGFHSLSQVQLCDVPNITARGKRDESLGFQRARDGGWQRGTLQASGHSAVTTHMGRNSEQRSEQFPETLKMHLC